MVSLLAMKKSNAGFDKVRISPKQVLDCPAGWTKNDDSCYKLMNNMTSWENAQLSCSIMGGYLVTVKSEDENSFLYSFGIKDYRFILLFDQ